jgi:DNA-binding protein HU-beta
MVDSVLLKLDQEGPMAASTTKKPTKRAAAAAPKRATRTAAAPAARKTASKAAPAARKVASPKATAKAKAATAQAKPVSMSGALPSIVTLKHLAEWAGYNHGVPKKQATAMLTEFVSDIGRVLKKGSKIRIPNLGILQVRVRPARPARKGRNPATGEEIRIKASKATKKVAFRVAKSLKEMI